MKVSIQKLTVLFLISLVVAQVTIAESYYSVDLSSTSFSIPIQTVTLSGDILSGTLETSSVSATYYFILDYNNKAAKILASLSSEADINVLNTTDKPMMILTNPGGDESPYIVVNWDSINFQKESLTTSSQLTLAPEEEDVTLTQGTFDSSGAATSTDAGVNINVTNVKVTSISAENRTKNRTKTPVPLTVVLLESGLTTAKSITDVKVKSITITNPAVVTLEKGILNFTRTDDDLQLTTSTVSYNGKTYKACYTTAFAIQGTDGKTYYIAALNNIENPTSCDGVIISVIMQIGQLKMDSLKQGSSDFALSDVQLSPDNPLKISDKAVTTNYKLEGVTVTGSTTAGSVTVLSIEDNTMGPLTIEFNKVEFVKGQYTLSCSTTDSLTLRNIMKLDAICMNPTLSVGGFLIGALNDKMEVIVQPSIESNQQIVISSPVFEVTPQDVDMTILVGSEGDYISNAITGTELVLLKAKSVSVYDIPDTKVQKMDVTTTIYNHQYITGTETTVATTTLVGGGESETQSNIPAVALLAPLGAAIARRFKRRE